MTDRKCENETYQSLTAFPWHDFNQENGHFRPANVFIVMICGIAGLCRIKWITERLLFRFVSCVGHAIISTQKYIVTGISSMKNATSSMKNETYQDFFWITLTSFWSRARIYLFSFFRPAKVSLVIMWDRFCLIHKWNEFPRGFCFDLLAVYDMPWSPARNILWHGFWPWHTI